VSAPPVDAPPGEAGAPHEASAPDGKPAE
jgi:hypothetical protein